MCLAQPRLSPWDCRNTAHSAHRWRAEPGGPTWRWWEAPRQWPAGCTEPQVSASTDRRRERRPCVAISTAKELRPGSLSCCIREVSPKPLLTATSGSDCAGVSRSHTVLCQLPPLHTSYKYRLWIFTVCIFRCPLIPTQSLQPKVKGLQPTQPWGRPASWRRRQRASTPTHCPRPHGPLCVRPESSQGSRGAGGVLPPGPLTGAHALLSRTPPGGDALAGRNTHD